MCACPFDSPLTITLPPVTNLIFDRPSLISMRYDLLGCFCLHGRYNAAGFVHVLGKPFDNAKLVATLDVCAGTARETV